MPAASPFIRSSMSRSFIMDEMSGSRASDTLVRSTYEMVYMTSATGIMRSQRCSVISRNPMRVGIPDGKGGVSNFSRHLRGLSEHECHECHECHELERS